MKRVGYLGNDVPDHWAESVEEHGAIMAAFQARDAEAAAGAMRAHLKNAWRRAAVVMEVPDAPSDQPDAPSSVHKGEG